MNTSPDQNYTSWQNGMSAVFVGWPEKVTITREANLFNLGEVYEVKGVRALCKGERISFDGRIGKVNRDAVFIKVLGEWALADGFRPAQPRKTSIEVFTAMLSPKPAKAGKVRA